MVGLVDGVVVVALVVIAPTVLPSSRRLTLAFSVFCFVLASFAVDTVVAKFDPSAVVLPLAATSCTTFHNLDEVLLGKKLYRQKKGYPNATTRYVTCNHKTGTIFAQCLCGVVEHESPGVPCAAGGYEHAFMGLQHTQGKGMTTTSFGINLIRNPFVMVHSGMQYHMTTTNHHEGWLFNGGPIEKRRFATQPAITMYQAWCKPDKAKLPLDKNYQQMLQVGQCPYTTVTTSQHPPIQCGRLSVVLSHCQLPVVQC